MKKLILNSNVLFLLITIFSSILTKCDRTNVRIDFTSEYHIVSTLIIKYHSHLYTKPEKKIKIIYFICYSLNKRNTKATYQYRVCCPIHDNPSTDRGSICLDNVIRYSSWKPKMEAWRESKRAACPQDLWLELIHQYQLFLDIGGRLVNGAESSFIYTSSRAQVNKSRNKKNIMRPPTSQLVAASMVSSFFLSFFILYRSHYFIFQCLATPRCKRCKSSDFKFPNIF